MTVAEPPASRPQADREPWTSSRPPAGCPSAASAAPICSPSTQTQLLQDVLPVFRGHLRRIGVVLHVLQRFLTGHLPGADEGREVRLPLVDVELPRQDVALKEARVDRLVVLPAVVAPAELVLEDV